jgi:hypothetical protein
MATRGQISTIHREAQDYYNCCPRDFLLVIGDHMIPTIYPIGSDCIDMNAFSTIPNLVVVNRNQASLIQLVEKQGLDVILAALQNVGRCVGHPSNRNANDILIRRGAFCMITSEQLSRNLVLELGHLDLRAREDRS